MSLLVDAQAIMIRRGTVEGPLVGLADSLAGDLDRVLAQPVFIPGEKAKLTRTGGRCAVDGTLLNFDPFAPRAHRCAVCGRVYSGEDHYRFWIYWYQLWLAERAVHAAALAALGRDARYARFAGEVLDQYATQYLAYPNRDNVLGPTRVFFSTYLESIWLLQICVALDLLETASTREMQALGARVRDRVIEPSLLLISSYDEGLSNRQVWNNAARIAAHRSLGNDGGAVAVVEGPSGLRAHLEHGLLGDGTWYEGENYHLFAHRGLWYGVTQVEEAGIALPADLAWRFQEGFATPFLTSLPDLTMPSRRDSQYKISLRQWRFAELCELGLARADDPRLVAALARLYGDAVARGDTGRACSSAEAERNSGASGLARTDLGWRSLLFALPALPSLTHHTLPSVLLEEQGIAVLRRESGEVYVALDYGHSGGGHGHPDRLNLLFARGETRWLDDMGTGSYVDESLHWYRSTLAHNAPLVDGRSQMRVDGWLDQYAVDEQRAVASAQAEIAPGVVVHRAVSVAEGSLTDEILWNALRDVRFDLPMHADLAPTDDGVKFTPERFEGGDQAEDGFGFVAASEFTALAAGTPYRFRASGGATYATVDLAILVDQPTQLWRCRGPGAPGQGSRRFAVLRANAVSGRFRIAWGWSDTGNFTFSPDLLTERPVVPSGARDAESRDPGNRKRPGQRSEVHRKPVDTSTSYLTRSMPDGSEAGNAIVLRRGEPIEALLGQEHYRRSEDDWAAINGPSADVSLAWDGWSLGLRVRVQRADRSFVAAMSINALDNEAADVNGAGVQIYLVAEEERALGTMLVPEAESSLVRQRRIPGWTDPRGELQVAEASWSQIPDGYELTARLRGLGAADRDHRIGLDLIINEKPYDRERRRGQLVLSGGAGEHVYLRGDRHDRARLIPILLTDG